VRHSAFTPLFLFHREGVFLMAHSQSRSVSRFTDLPALFAEMTATPEFRRAFGDPIPLSIIQPGDEPGEHDMPDPLHAQADCAAIIATIFDLLTDTRLDALAAEIAWGFVNSFHYVAGKLEKQEDALADELREMIRHSDISEVFNTELEEKQLLCQSLTEQRDAVECMRDYAAEMFRVLSGRPWSAARGSRVSKSVPRRRWRSRISCGRGNWRIASAIVPVGRLSSPRGMPNGTTGNRSGIGWISSRTYPAYDIGNDSPAAWV
jgi:hypothetical protein